MAPESEDAYELTERFEEALIAAGLSQKELAAVLGVSATKITRAKNPGTRDLSLLRRAEELLGPFIAKDPVYELFVSCPITALDPTVLESHRQQVEAVVREARQPFKGCFWPGEGIRKPQDYLRPYIATRQNMQVLGKCRALLFVQFAEITRPCGALVELGIALGRRIPCIVFILKGLEIPYMLRNLDAVAGWTDFLPNVQLQPVESAADAVEIIRRNGRKLLD